MSVLVTDCPGNSFVQETLPRAESRRELQVHTGIRRDMSDAGIECPTVLDVRSMSASDALNRCWRGNVAVCFW